MKFPIVVLTGNKYLAAIHLYLETSSLWDTDLNQQLHPSYILLLVINTIALNQTTIIVGVDFDCNIPTIILLQSTESGHLKDMQQVRFFNLT